MNWRDCLSKAAIFAAASAMIYFGVERGELKIIFAKAVRLCLECTGLG
ncbi:MAG: thioredoxin [Selenomonadaceae bacterium]|nr:thioredoxin [Selenomonadaceae bacterium]